MGISSLLGFGNEISGVLDSAGDLIDRTFTSDEERLQAQEVIEKLQAEGAKGQHRSLFVAGWRPFIGWTCGLSLFYAHIGQHIANWILIAFFQDTPLLPEIPQDSLQTLTYLALAILGVYGSQRTVEKIAGKTK